MCVMSYFNSYKRFFSNKYNSHDVCAAFQFNKTCCFVCRCFKLSIQSFVVTQIPSRSTLSQTVAFISSWLTRAKQKQIKTSENRKRVQLSFNPVCRQRAWVKRFRFRNSFRWGARLYRPLTLGTL